MYCKHCGKIIADDSKFCQHCGGSQEDLTTPINQNVQTNSSQKKENVVEIPTIKANFSDTTKWWIIGCGIWFVINLYWLFAGDKSSSASEYFQPFSDKMDSSYSYYDITEFIVYVFGIPLFAWALVMINKKLNEDNDSPTTSSNPSSIKENNDINDTLGIK